MSPLDAASYPPLFLALVIAFLYAITVHEASHAFVADWLGDSTSRFRGRLTLNPVAHLDVTGTLMLVIIGFGWGKPVPVNSINLRGDPRRGMATVAAAGPAANFLSAIVLGLILRATLASGIDPNFGQLVLGTLILINFLLGIFNLIPVPPLDGFTLLLAFVDAGTAQRIRFYSRQISMVFIGIIVLDYFLRLNLIGSLLIQPAQYLARLVLGEYLLPFISDEPYLWPILVG